MDLILLIGLQASGKSTFYRTHFAATHEHVSKDLFPNNRNPNKRQLQLIENAFQAHRPVVVDNTNPTVEIREPLIQLGRTYDARIIGYYFESEVRQCIARNKQRTGKGKVPDVAIYVTSRKLTRPTYAEGFDELYYVRIADNGTFTVQGWAENETIPLQSQPSVHPQVSPPIEKPSQHPVKQNDA